MGGAASPRRSRRVVFGVSPPHDPFFVGRSEMLLAATIANVHAAVAAS
jgi:hypothetical protein